jgi:chemosensory pili system protein ChpA (sensor histidine kinase/response regulator)
MPTFSIDDVRETFTADVSSFIGRIEDGARLLLEAPPLSTWTGGDDQTSEPRPDGRPLFEIISELGHAIVGTTSLVGADSLTDSARTLEVLALDGHQAFVDLDRCLTRARRVAVQCSEGARRMRSMLELELGKRASEALWESMEWVESVTGRAPETEVVASGAATVVVEGEDTAKTAAATAAEGHGEAPASVGAGVGEALSQGGGLGEFSFDDQDVPAPALSAELREIFDEEARSAVTAIQDELRALRTNPASGATAANLERLFHTLKGAAATVGLAEISDIAAALQERMEGVVEAGAPVPADFVDELVGDINEMLRVAGLPPIDLGMDRDGPADEDRATAATREAHAFFLEEARAALPEVTRAIPALSDADPQAAARARDELGRLFHRIKGSALIVGETAIGEESERLQLLMEQEETSQVSAVAETEVWLALLRSRLSGAPASADAAAEPTARGARAAGGGMVRHPVQMSVNPELGEAFMQECGELMESIDRELLSIEESNQPKEVVDTLMRHVHTLKGVVNTVGLAPTGEMLHHVEDLLEGLAEAPILPPMRAVATLLFAVQGDVRKHLKQGREGFVEMDLPRLDARIARLLGRSKTVSGDEPTGASLAGLTVGAHTGGQVSASVAPGASIHSIHSANSVLGVRSDEGPSRSAASDNHDDQAARRTIRVATDRLDALMNLAGELVVSRSRMLTRVGTLRAVQQEIQFGHKRLVETIDGFSEEHEFATLSGGAHQRGSGSGRARAPEVVAAPAAKGADSGTAATQGTSGAALDADGRDMAGELESFGELELDRYEDIQILSRRLTEMTSDFSEMNLQLARNLAAFNDDSEIVGRIVTAIQGEVTRARMVPLDQLFTRLRLPVRDAATRENKEIRVAVEGADVHIDKTIADALFQPMLHLVRNSAVHGIERPATRERTGKSGTGIITLRARQESGQIVVEVADDGGGLDLDRLKARGVAMGLIAAETPLSDPTIPELVFVAGLSTRDQAGAVSGRGVGCDVVRRSVERLNGTIRVESRAGRGTIFVITLPVTLAITKALIVRHGDRTYAIPMHFAERIVDAQEEALIESAGIHRIKIDDAFLSVKRLEQFFQTDAETSKMGPVLLLRVGTSRTVLQVDAVLGQEEIVVKSLGDVLAGHPIFAGVTVRGSGELSLIVDVPGLLQDRARKAGTAGEERRRSVARRQPGASAGAAVAADAAAERTGRPAATQLPSAASLEPSRPLRVLFIDDSLSVRKFAQITLAELGADVTVAVDGVDGLAKIREGSFDLVFTDLEMPRMHGFELIRQIRFLPAYRDLPIAVVTSRSGTKHQQQARALGATAYLTKPFTAQNLDAILKRWGRRGAAAAVSASGEGTSATDSQASRRGDGTLS